MQQVVSKSGDGTQDAANVPQQIRVEVIEDIAGKSGPERGGYGPGQPEYGHVAAAHVFRGKAGGQGLAGRYDNHLTDRDDNNIQREEQERAEDAKQGKTDH